MTPEAFAKHVIELADAFGVMVRTIDRGEDSRASLGVAMDGQVVIKAVEIAPVVDETTYAIALHELGHLCAPNGSIMNKTRTEPAMVMLAERSAWEWARHFAIVWTDQMQRVHDMALGTYEVARATGSMAIKHAMSTGTFAPPRRAEKPVAVGSASDFAKRIKIGGDW